MVNAYYTSTRFSGDAGAQGYGSFMGGQNGDNSANITTGLLPNYLSVSGKTRQNDLDVSFTISIQPGASTTNAGQQGGTVGGISNQENRQAFLTFGDKSWGSIKLGKDLGIFASDAILNDMTLLGVGSGAGMLAGNTTTLGRIGSGFMYADWKSQVAYTSPNWNGFQFTAGVTQAWNALDTNKYTEAGWDGSYGGSATSSKRGGNSPAFEAKASYEWTGDVAGKVWVSGISQRVKDLSFTSYTGSTPDALGSETSTAWDIGANVNVAGFGLTAYYYDGRGIGQTVQLNNAFDTSGKKRDSHGGYVQGTYTIPGVGTKVGASWGKSVLEKNSLASETRNGYGMLDDQEDTMWTVGVYHPLTKHLNLVAEYSDVKSEGVNSYTEDKYDAKAKTVSLGAILFF